MSHRTIRHVRADLATAFPGVMFGYGTAGRGRDKGHCVSWEGGPSADAVRAAADVSWRTPYHFQRQHTAAEWEVIREEWSRESAEREAAAPAIRAANLAAGKVKAAKTRTATAAVRALLAAAWPGVAFTVTGKAATYGNGDPWLTVSWVDGPGAVDVASRVGASHTYNRHVTPARRLVERQDANAILARQEVAAAAAKQAGRLARRLAASRQRRVATGRGIARARQATRQMALCFA